MSQISNFLLAALSPAYRASLLARFKPVSLPATAIIYEPNANPEYAHFITSGVVSIICVMSDGSSAEVGLWGREGLIECFHLLGGARIPNRCIVQIGGTALRMPFKELQEEFLASAEMRDRVLQCVQTQSAILGQLAACNRLHESEARLARWLLMVRDHVESDSFHVTQELLATMLGARRTTVTAAAGMLKQKDLVKYTRGNLHVTDPEGLERAACECYQAVRQLRRNFYREPADRLASAVDGPNGQVHD